jgi:hypothetical protein
LGYWVPAQRKNKNWFKQMQEEAIKLGLNMKYLDFTKEEDLYQTDVLFHKSPQILCSKDPKDVVTSNNFKKFISLQPWIHVVGP